MNEYQKYLFVAALCIYLEDHLSTELHNAISGSQWGTETMDECVQDAKIFVTKIMQAQ